MPRPDHQFGPGGPGGPPQDPALVLATLKLNRAQLAANTPTDEEFEAVIAAQADAARAQRTASQERLASLDEAIANLESQQS